VVGEVWQWVGNYAPRGTQLAHGQIVSIAQYPTLHFLVGDTYGGDNITTFGLPDLRGLEPEGVNYVICMFGNFPSMND
jgi:microcystin-dependent protein